MERQIKFVWLCDNPRKIGKKIYGQELLHFDFIKTLSRPQSIVTVANEMAQVEIKSFFARIDQHSMQDYFFFC